MQQHSSRALLLQRRLLRIPPPGKCCTLERRFVPPYAVNLYLFDDASSQSSEISNVECKVAYKLC
jgi:hypothetical protein